jgi:DNA-binding MarR family transcriptional regulator
MQDERLRGSLANAVVRLFRMVNRVHNRKLGAVGISAEQAHVLSVLDVLGPLTIGKLQKMLALSSPTLTGAIDRMEADGLVRRAPSAEDRRAVVVESRIAPKRWAQITAAIADGERACFGALTAAETKELLRLIAKCVDALDETT